MKITLTTRLAILSAILLSLAWPPVPYTGVLLFIALVPLLWGLEHIAKSNAAKKGKKIFFTALLTFFIWNLASTYWIYNAVSAYNNGITGAVISAFVCLIPFGLGAALLSLAFWLFYHLQQVVNKPYAYIGLIIFVIAAEYTQQTWDLAFPWMTLGNGFSGLHQVVQWYDVTGVYGGSLWILLSNVLAFEAWKQYKAHTGYLKYRTAGIWLLVLIFPTTQSLIKYHSFKEGVNPSNIVVVQPNVDPYLKFGSLSAREQVENLIRLSDSVAHPNTEFFIWPETAIPNYADEEKINRNDEFLQTQHFLNKYKNGTLITGIESVRWYNTEKTLSAKYVPDYRMYIDNFNAAMLVENSAEVQFYHKSKLVPGVEKLPFPGVTGFLKPVFAQLGGTVGGWGWQEAPTVFYAQSGIGVAPVICYESLWGDWIGKSVKEGAQLIAVITNDGWWGNTSGKDQHLLYAKLRAIETRRYVARSANTGISAVVNQRGDIVKKADWWTRSAFNIDVNLNSDITFYVKNGDILAGVAYIAAMLLAVFIFIKKWAARIQPKA